MESAGNSRPWKHPPSRYVITRFISIYVLIINSSGITFLGGLSWTFPSTPNRGASAPPVSTVEPPTSLTPSTTTNQRNDTATRPETPPHTPSVAETPPVPAPAEVTRSLSSEAPEAAEATEAEREGAQESGEPPVSYREKQWRAVLDPEVVDVEALKKLSWNGIPARFRPQVRATAEMPMDRIGASRGRAQVWQMLLAYLPSDKRRREPTVARKRREYADAVAQYYDLVSPSRSHAVAREPCRSPPRRRDPPFTPRSD